MQGDITNQKRMFMVFSSETVDEISRFHVQLNQVKMINNNLLQTQFVSSLKNGDHSALHSVYDTFAAEVVATCRIKPEEWLDARTALLAVEVEIQSFIHIASVAAKETIAIAKKALDLVKGVADIIREYCSRIAIHIPSRTTANDSAPPKKESKRETKMKWTGTKADLYEKIYGDYLMGSFNNGKATLAELVSHHGEIYGMALTEEECYQTLRRMKGRRGKDKRPYHDHTFKIHSRTYYISEAAWRLNELMRKHEDGDGRRTRTEIKPYPGSTMI